MLERNYMLARYTSRRSSQTCVNQCGVFHATLTQLQHGSHIGFVAQNQQICWASSRRRRLLHVALTHAQQRNSTPRYDMEMRFGPKLAAWRAALAQFDGGSGFSSAFSRRAGLEP